MNPDKFTAPGPVGGRGPVVAATPRGPAVRVGVEVQIVIADLLRSCDAESLGAITGVLEAEFDRRGIRR